jgi:hypothetical protein
MATQVSDTVIVRTAWLSRIFVRMRMVGGLPGMPVAGSTRPGTGAC